MVALNEGVAIVTGGGSGMGLGIARRFAELGTKVVVGRTAGKIEEVVAEIGRSGGRLSPAPEMSVAKKTSHAWWTRRSRSSGGWISPPMWLERRMRLKCCMPGRCRKSKMTTPSIREASSCR